MTRIALGIEYDGSHYYGWQRQINVPSIQSQLETAIAKIANKSVFLHCAGRTDKGVHALGQVVHFDTPAKREVDAWVLGSNCYLPSDIRVRWAKRVDHRFHARHYAQARRYLYVIDNSPTAPAIMQSRMTWHYQRLACEPMSRGAKYLLGKHDFTSFRASGCQANLPVRVIKHIEVSQKGSLIFVDVKADAFLHHMVRNIVGVLMEVGIGRKPPEWVAEVLASCDRTKAGLKADANGLYLAEVDYPEHYDFPKVDLARYGFLNSE